MKRYFLFLFITSFFIINTCSIVNAQIPTEIVPSASESIFDKLKRLLNIAESKRNTTPNNINTIPDNPPSHQTVADTNTKEKPKTDEDVKDQKDPIYKKDESAIDKILRALGLKKDTPLVSKEKTLDKSNDPNSGSPVPSLGSFGGGGGSGMNTRSNSQSDAQSGPTQSQPANSPSSSGNQNTYPQQQVQNTDPSYRPEPIDCNGKKLVLIGFAGMPNRGGGPNSSDGIDDAVKKYSGKRFEYTEFEQAKTYALNLSEDLNNTEFIIIGHSAGANTAIHLANSLAETNRKVAAVVVADSRGTPISPQLAPVTIGLYSGTSFYAQANSGGGRDIRMTNLNHFQIDNKIIDYIKECKDQSSEPSV